MDPGGRASAVGPGLQPPSLYSASPDSWFLRDKGYQGIRRPDRSLRKPRRASQRGLCPKAGVGFQQGCACLEPVFPKHTACGGRHTHSAQSQVPGGSGWLRATLRLAGSGFGIR